MHEDEGSGTATLQPPIAAPAAAVKFGSADNFGRELRRRVEEYFAQTGRSPRDCPKMYVKTAIVLGFCAVFYGLLLFVATSWWVAVPVAALLGLSMATAAFNVQHDGGHGAYSRYKWINKATAMTLDLLGGSSYVWARKHNAYHHSYTNVTGQDDDINMGILGRLSPHQKRLSFHRLQHFYLWGLYGFLPVKWHLYDDFHEVLTGRCGSHRLARPRGWDLVTFLGGKAVFFSLAFAIPMMLHPFWSVVALYGVATFIQGVVLSVVFQLAHCAEEAEFPLPDAETGRMETGWATHQVQTTVDFAPQNRWLSWYVGGLNFQIEHHLFPQICHIHYPKLAPLVRQTCEEFGLRYSSHATLRAGIASHFRWLRRMGAPTPA